MSIESDYKYIGVFINDGGYDDNDIHRQIIDIFARGNILFQILKIWNDIALRHIVVAFIVALCGVPIRKCSMKDSELPIIMFWSGKSVTGKAFLK